MSKVVKILLADDDKEDQYIMADSFREIGVLPMIHFVEDGEKVLEYLNGILPSEELPRLIVLDLNMPRLNGTETLRLLKSNSRYQHIPIIIFSTSVNDIEKRKCIESGAAAYITKPVRYDESLNTARRFYEYCTTDMATDFKA